MTTQVKGLIAISLTTGALLGLAFLFLRDHSKSSVFLLGWTGLQSMAAFLALVGSLRKSNKVFYSIFLGDAAIRLVTLAVATYLLHLRSLPYAAPLITLAVSYLVLSLVQIPFLLHTPA